MLPVVKRMTSAKCILLLVSLNLYISGVYNKDTEAGTPVGEDTLGRRGW